MSSYEPELSVGFSMSGSPRRGFVSRCCGCLFSLGFSSLILWLSFRTFTPRCYLQDIYLPALNQSSNSQDNTTLSFALRLENPNKAKGVYYDDLNVTFFDAPNRSRVIGSSVIPRFYQGYGKKATKTGSLNGTEEGVVFRAVPANGSTAVFRVDLVTAVRFKIMWWKTKREKIEVGADIEVNEQGTKVNEKKIRLKSVAATKNMRATMVVVVLMIFFSIYFS